jgi:YbgC/YbaW family acyl-CoA thioester hydrolase
MEMARKYTMQVQVEDYYIDSYGHVSDTHFLSMMAQARSHFMGQIGYPAEGYLSRGTRFFVKDMYVKFERSVSVGDSFEVSLWFQVIKRTNVILQQEIRLELSDEIVASASISCGFADKDKNISIPPDFLKKIQPYYSPDHWTKLTGGISYDIR